MALMYPRRARVHVEDSLSFFVYELSGNGRDVEEHWLELLNDFFVLVAENVFQLGQNCADVAGVR